MAADKTTANEELESLAFEIFNTASAHAPVNRNGEQLAAAAYNRAGSWLSYRDKVRKGEINPAKPTGPQLAECCAPNLPKMHPHNLVSRVMGNLEKVNRIAKFLKANPPTEERPESDIAEQINREIPELNWNESAVKTARVIFPSYVAN